MRFGTMRARRGWITGVTTLFLLSGMMPALASDDDVWDSWVTMEYSLQGREMIDADGDYSLSFDQRPRPNPKAAWCDSEGMMTVELWELDGWWHSNTGSRTFPKDCVTHWNSWFTNYGGKLMQYRFFNTDDEGGASNGPVQSRDAQ